MTQLSILTASEQKIFDQPPVLNNDERHVYFSITPDIRPTLSRIQSPVNKAGFMLQLGYFRANARFYPAKTFHRRDISYGSQNISGRDSPLSGFKPLISQ